MRRVREEGYGVRELRLRVRTGTHLLAGTEALVWMRLCGREDRTQWFAVRPEEGAFRRGEVDEVVLRLGPAVDPGEIVRIDVYHDDSGSFSGWYLDQIEVDGEVLHYDCWLAADEPPYRLDATSLYDEELRAYDVRVRTSEALFAGTDARVFLQLFGSRGTTPWIRLFTPGHRHFVSGQVDEWRLFAEDIGALLGVWVRHDSKGIADGWRLDWIEVDGRRMAFDRWLARSSGNGRTDAFHRVRPWIDAQRPLELGLCTFAGLEKEAERALTQDLASLDHLLGRHGIEVRRADRALDLVLPEPWLAWQARHADPRELLDAVADVRREQLPARAGRVVPVWYGGRLEHQLHLHPGLSRERNGIFLSLPTRHEASIGHEIGRFFGLAPSHGCEDPDGPSSRLRHLRNPQDVLDGHPSNVMSQSDAPLRRQGFTAGQLDAMVLRMLRYVG
ncbi:MAG: hypothetical protein RIT45_499 [Pseudomonadota bacterium]